MKMDYDKGLPFLEKATKERDMVFLADHGDEALLHGLRMNVSRKVASLTIAKVLPQWLVLGLALFGMSFRDNSVFVTFGNQKSTYILMTLQYLFSWIRKPRPHVLIDCLWEPGRSFPARMLVRIRAHLINRVASKCVVYGMQDIESFNKILGISREKLIFVPYHHTLRGAGCDLESVGKHLYNGDYIFSGGTDGRDYDILMRVCEELALPLKIATLDEKTIMKGKNRELFEIRRTTPSEFRRLMAGSRLVVIPYGKTILRTGGHQTFLNAMLMGKAVILYNDNIAKGYITNGINGIVVPYGDIEKLKENVYELYYSREKREELGRAAHKWIIDSGMTQKRWVERVYGIAAAEYYRKI